MDLDFRERLSRLETRFKRFSIVGTDDVQVSGNLKSGFIVNVSKVGGGGSSGTGTPTGACCYNDGTCDDLTCVDCEDAGGTCQGLGTICADVSCPIVPTGACCADDGSCSVSTAAECTGSYQGDGTDCDPNPCPTPTGACCKGVLCNDGITADDCATAGGSYQGDGSNCSDCPCGHCGFAEFIPSDPPVYYLTKTDTYVRSASETSGHPTCDETDNFTTTSTYTVNEDGSCSLVVTCSGSATSHIEGEGECTTEWVSNGMGGCKEDGIGCPGCVANACADVALTVTSATTASGTCDFSDGGGATTAHLEMTSTLSNPFSCSGGFSPPP